MTQGQLIIDRVEGDWVVAEDTTGQICNLPLSWFDSVPPEGAIFKVVLSMSERGSVLTTESQRATEELHAELFAGDDGEDFDL